MSFRWWPKQGTRRLLLIGVLVVAVSIVLATTKMTFGGGRRITCVLCLLLNLRPKLPSRCVVVGSWSIKSLADVL